MEYKEMFGRHPSPLLIQQLTGLLRSKMPVPEPSTASTPDKTTPKDQDHATAFRAMVKAVNTCLDYEQFYTSAEDMETKLLQMQEDLDKRSVQVKEEEIAYNKLLNSHREYVRDAEAKVATSLTVSETHQKRADEYASNIEEQRKNSSTLKAMLKQKEKLMGEKTNELLKVNARLAELQKNLSRNVEGLKAVQAQLDASGAELRRWQAYRATLISIDEDAL